MYSILENVIYSIVVCEGEFYIGGFELLRFIEPVTHATMLYIALSCVRVSST